MDKFEQILSDMRKMSADEQAKAVEGLKPKCICPGCPTYTNCAKNAKELLFCTIGKSFMCIDREKECMCPKCPNTLELGLKHNFFCTRGAEKAQRYEKALWGTRML